MADQFRWLIPTAPPIRRVRPYAAMKKYWEIIADHLSESGWSLGWISFVDAQGRTMFSVDTHRSDGKRFVVKADELPTAFLELEEQLRPIAAPTTQIADDHFRGALP